MSFCSTAPGEATHTLNRGGLRFDMQAKTISAKEQLLSFTKGEYGICEYLALHPGQVFTKEQLYDIVIEKQHQVQDLKFPESGAVFVLV